MINCPEVIDTLNAIKQMLGATSNDKYMVAVVGLAGVLVGALSNGLFQIISARLASEKEHQKLHIQLRADVITKQRQEWMDSVRDVAKDLFAAYDILYHKHSGYPVPPNDSRQALYDTFAKSSLIELKLNAEKPTQKTIIDSMKKLQVIIEKMTAQNRHEYEKEYLETKDEMKNNMVALFQETWTKIKNLQ